MKFFPQNAPVEVFGRQGVRPCVAGGIDGRFDRHLFPGGESTGSRVYGDVWGNPIPEAEELRSVEVLEDSKNRGWLAEGGANFPEQKGVDKMDREVVDELKEKVALACRVLAKLGLVEWLGHISARIPGEEAMVIKGRSFEASDMKKTSKEHMIIQGFDGKVREGKLQNPFEWPMHACIFRKRSDVEAVVHTHQVMATAFVTAGKTILPIWHPGLATPVATPPPVFDDPSLLLTVEQGDQLAKTLGSHKVCLLRGHGVITVGKSVEEATLTAIYLEKQAEMNYLTLQIGTPKRMSDSELDLRPTAPKTIQGHWAYFKGLVEGE